VQCLPGSTFNPHHSPSPRRLRVIYIGGHFEGERNSHCRKAAGLHGNSAPVGKVFKNALWTALRIIFRPKTHYFAGFCITLHYSLAIFPRWCPGLPQERPRCL